MSKLIKKTIQKLLPLVAMSFVACSRDSVTSTSPLVGTWKFSEMRVYDGKTGKFLQSEGVDDCFAQSRVVFIDDSNMVSKIYSEGAKGECKYKGEEKATYKYDASFKIITAIVDGKPKVREVKRLTATELEIVTEHYDVNKDGVEDEHSTVFVRVE